MREGLLRPLAPSGGLNPFDCADRDAHVNTRSFGLAVEDHFGPAGPMGLNPRWLACGGVSVPSVRMTVHQLQSSGLSETEAEEITRTWRSADSPREDQSDPNRIRLILTESEPIRGAHTKKKRIRTTTAHAVLQEKHPWGRYEAFDCPGQCCFPATRMARRVSGRFVTDRLSAGSRRPQPAPHGPERAGFRAGQGRRILQVLKSRHAVVDDL